MSQQDADPMPFSEEMAELRAAIRAVVVPPLDRIAGWLNRLIERGQP